MKKNSFWNTISTHYKFQSIAVLVILAIVLVIAIVKSIINYLSAH